MDGMNRLVDTLIKAIDQRQGKKTKGYSTQAEVLRVQNGTAWVHIPGGADETPVQETIACKKGDTVQVRVEGGKATLTGNQSAPPTDDTKADKAQETADDAAEVAEEAKAEAEGTSQYFWYMNGSTSEAGAHVTEVPASSFRQKPSGGNILMRSNSVRLRLALVTLAELTGAGLDIYEPSDSVNPVAQFKGANTIIGKETEYHVKIGSSVIDFLLNTTRLFSIIWKPDTLQPEFSYCAVQKESVENSKTYRSGLRISRSSSISTSRTTPGALYESSSVNAGIGSARLTAEYDATNSGGDDVTAEILVSSTSNGADIEERADEVRFYPAYRGSDDPPVITIDGVNGDISATGKASFDSLDNNIFAVTTETVFASTTITGAQKYGTVSITKANYYPLGVVGWNSPDTSAFVPARLRLSAQAAGSGTISYSIRNVSGGSESGKFNADILWLKVA